MFWEQEEGDLPRFRLPSEARVAASKMRVRSNFSIACCRTLGYFCHRVSND
jgi:hypothetical protein